MSLAFTHKPNYFLFAQLIIRHIESYVHKHPDTHQIMFDLRDIHELFQEDKASATINLDGILNIADEYKVDTLEGDQKLINHYRIDGKENKLHLELNPLAANSLRSGKDIIPPDATLHE